MRLIVLIFKLWAAMFRGDDDRIRAIIDEMDMLREKSWKK